MSRLPNTVHLPVIPQPTPPQSHSNVIPPMPSPSDSSAYPSPMQSSSATGWGFSDDTSDMDSQSDTERALQSRASTDDVSNLLQQLESYTPTIPTDVTKYLLNKAGALVDDNGVKLVSLAAQMFITDILERSVRCSYTTVAKTDPQSKTFKQSDLEMVLKDTGISVQKPPFFFSGKR
ncbi:hypothetical protein RCL1_001859 [Eukaryota sp. TZLM3-RCL]